MRMGLDLTGAGAARGDGRATEEGDEEGKEGAGGEGPGASLLPAPEPPGRRCSHPMSPCSSLPGPGRCPWGGRRAVCSGPSWLWAGGIAWAPRPAPPGRSLWLPRGPQGEHARFTPFWPFLMGTRGKQVGSSARLSAVTQAHAGCHPGARRPRVCPACAGCCAGELDGP